MTDTSPAESFGGTWTVIDGGKYLRAANDSQAGGSDTISVEQMPSHAHGATRSISGTLSTNSEGTANFALTGKVVDREYTWDVFTTSAGGGNRSTRRIKMCTHGTGSPNQESGDAKWHSLIFSKLSTLLGQSTSHQYPRLPQKSSVVRGSRSQTEGSGVHWVHMVQLADKIPSCSTIRTFREDSGTPITRDIMTLLDIGIARKCLIARLTPVLTLAWVSGIERTQRTLFQQSRHTVLVIVGSESPSLLAVA